MKLPEVMTYGNLFSLEPICQINLKDLPKDCNVLPHKGLLLIFGDISYYSGDWPEPSITMEPSDNRVCRLLYVPEEKMDQLVSGRKEYRDCFIVEPFPIKLDHTPPIANEPDLQLFGESSHLEWETWPEPCENWKLLLQMDSMEREDYTFNFIDWGVLCFLIKEEDLNTLDFSDVRAIVLST